MTNPATLNTRKRQTDRQGQTDREKEKNKKKERKIREIFSRRFVLVIEKRCLKILKKTTASVDILCPAVCISDVINKAGMIVSDTSRAYPALR